MTQNISFLHCGNVQQDFIFSKPKTENLKKITKN